jgi:hypothetical protein
MMFHNLFLVVILSLRLQRLSDGNDSVDIMPTDFKVTLFDVPISAGGSALVIMESSLILLFSVVVSEMNAREDKVGVVL